MISKDQAGLLIDGGQVVGSDGEKIGTVGQVYLDNETGNPSWVTVKTGWFGASESFVPLDEASLDGSTVTVPYDKATVKDAPHHDVDAELTAEEEQDLYSYYGLTHAGGVADRIDSDRARTAAADVDAARGTASSETGAGYITRSEEQLRVGTRQVEAGRARLRKFVVTEQQTVTVPVSHEEVTVVREPIAAGEVTDAVIGDDAVEVVLTQDQVVVDKQAVAVEKVKLGTQTITEEQQVTEAVRKEQIELDTDGLDTSDTTRTTGTQTEVGTDPSLADKAKGLVDKAKGAVK